MTLTTPAIPSHRAGMRRSLVAAALLASAAAVPAYADDIVNPGFETGDATGWTTGGGYWSSGTWPPLESEYSGPPNLLSVMTAGGTDAITGAPTVFGGNYALRLNDSGGGNDITAISQTVLNYNGNKIYYAWNAVLEPSHGATDSPSFIIKVVDQTTGQVVTNIAYSAYTAQNTTLFRSVNGWVTSDWKVEDIDAITGHDYKMVFVAVDCLYGGHGGYVYVDGFGNAIPVANAGVNFDPTKDVVKGANILIPIGGTPDIDLAVPFYTTTQLLAGSVNPNFVGGTLQVDGAGPITTAFTVGSQGGFIDTNGNDIEFSGPFTGTGALGKIGLGKLLLTGVSTIDGGFTIGGGVVDLAGTLSTSTVQVNSGGTLMGNGSVVGNIAVGSGGVLAPGSSIGTLRVVAGNVTMGTGSTLQLQIDGRTYSSAGGSGTYDRLALSGGGTVFTAGGAIAPVLRGIPAPATNTFTPVLGDRFTVVTADSVTGQFASVTQPASGMAANRRFDVIYNPKNVELVVTPGSFATLGQTAGWRKNAIGAGAGLDAVRPSAGTRNGTLQTLFNGLYGMDEPQLAKAFQQISGEIHANAMAINRQTGSDTADMALDAARSMIGGGCDASADARERSGDANRNEPAHCDSARGRMAVWGKLTSQNQKLDPNAVSAGFKSSQTGFATGVHVVNSENTRIGFGGRITEADVSSRIGSSADVNSTGLFVYASHDFPGGFNLSGVASWTGANVGARRTLTLLSGTSVSHAKYDVTSFTGAIEASMSVPIGAHARLRPVAGLTFDNTKGDAVQETNTDPNLQLALTGRSWNTTQSKLGAEADFGLGGPVQGRVFGNWRHALSGHNTFARAVAEGPAKWRVSPGAVKDDTYEFGAGIGAAIGKNAMVRLDYTGTRDGSNLNVDRGSLTLSVAF